MTVKTEQELIIAVVTNEPAVTACLEPDQMPAPAIPEHSVNVSLEVEEARALATEEPGRIALPAAEQFALAIAEAAVNASLEPQGAIAAVTTEPVLAAARAEPEAVLAVATDDAAATCRENLNRRKVWKHM